MFKIVKPYNQIYKIASGLGLKWFGFLLFIQHRLRFPRKINVKATIKGFPVVLKNRADLWAIRSVFEFEHYNIPAKKPKLIFDLGANIGMASLYFKWKYPEAKIIAVEPNPFIFDQLQGNTSVTCLKRAISVNKKEKLYIDKNHSSSSILKENNQLISVYGISINDLINKFGTPDIIKFDIEGSEYDVFKKANLNGVKWLVGKYHTVIIKKPVEDFLKFFPNYKVIKNDEYKSYVRWLILKRK